MVASPVLQIDLQALMEIVLVWSASVTTDDFKIIMSCEGLVYFHGSCELIGKFKYWIISKNAISNLFQSHKNDYYSAVRQEKIYWTWR